jgi:ATP-dependent Clp protease ATP-binding subunit ClpC
MFEKFTPEARRAVVLAQEEARALNHHNIHPLHLLIALTRDDDTIAGEALYSLDVYTEELQRLTAACIGSNLMAPAATIPFTNESRTVLERANELHLKLNHPKVGPEHILMALTTASPYIPSEVYTFFGITEAQLQETVARLMVTKAAPSGPTDTARSTTAPPPPTPARPSSPCTPENCSASPTTEPSMRTPGSSTTRPPAVTRPSSTATSSS